jgi:hypothetical protein
MWHCIKWKKRATLYHMGRTNEVGRGGGGRRRGRKRQSVWMILMLKTMTYKIIRRCVRQLTCAAQLMSILRPRSSYRGNRCLNSTTTAPEVAAREGVGGGWVKALKSGWTKGGKRERRGRGEGGSTKGWIESREEQSLCMGSSIKYDWMVILQIYALNCI